MSQCTNGFIEAGYRFPCDWFLMPEEAFERMLDDVDMTPGEKTHFQLCRAQHQAALRYQVAACAYPGRCFFFSETHGGDSSPQDGWRQSEKCAAHRAEAEWLRQAKDKNGTWDFYKIVSRSLESGRLQTALCDAVVKRPLAGGIDDADTVKRHRAEEGEDVAPWRIGREDRKHVVAGVLMT